MKTTPPRSKIAVPDTWDLSPLFSSSRAWDAALKNLTAKIPRIDQFRGTLGQSAGHLADFMDFYADLDLTVSHLGVYAELRQCEDGGNSEAQARLGRFMAVATQLEVALAWSDSEILQIPPAKIAKYLTNSRLSPYKTYLERILRQKPHILDENGEKILAQYAENADLAQKTFEMLTDVDMDFGQINGRPLTHGTLSAFLKNPSRDIRRRAYTQFYKVFSGHQNTLAALYIGSVKQDKIKTGLRKFNSTLERSLFANNVPVKVYHNLIKIVNQNLPLLHRYYALKKRLLGLDKLSIYDVHVPVAQNPHQNTPYEAAVELSLQSLSPLGSEYTDILRRGLTTDRWVDRYENQGKLSGAFSSGYHGTLPYILLNYKDDDFRSVLTLTHEAGHSMHTYFSTKNQPQLLSNYSIFVAEVASTVNENLLIHHLLNDADTALQKAILDEHISNFVSSFFRQTMFAEFELKIYEMMEKGHPLTTVTLRQEYRQLLQKYFGDRVELLPESDLECLRIPHFYRAFYVYQYATGTAAATALCQKILTGGTAARQKYLKFLSLGNYVFPIDALKVAGVDMSRPEPLQLACDDFKRSLDALEKIV
jgi:oligoendopeptidase F